jgi:hypothetical protein
MHLMWSSIMLQCHHHEIVGTLHDLMFDDFKCLSVFVFSFVSHVRLVLHLRF